MMGAELLNSSLHYRNPRVSNQTVWQGQQEEAGRAGWGRLHRGGRGGAGWGGGGRGRSSDVGGGSQPGAQRWRWWPRGRPGLRGWWSSRHSAGWDVVVQMANTMWRPIHASTYALPLTSFPWWMFWHRRPRVIKNACRLICWFWISSTFEHVGLNMMTGLQPSTVETESEEYRSHNNTESDLEV